MIHHFRESLRYSHDQSDQPWWDEVYRRAFPDMVATIDLRPDGWHQRAGRDRAIVLSTGKTLYVDEKCRKETYPDILVEIWSVYPLNGQPPFPSVRGTKLGWACEPKDTDWLAYAFVPSRKCHLLPFLGIRSAWLKKGHRWAALAGEKRDGFRYVVSPNDGYDSINIAVPTDILYRAINNAMTVTWDAEPS